MRLSTDIQEISQHATLTVSKAERELDWKAEFTIDEMVRDAWNFEQKQGLIEL